MIRSLLILLLATITALAQPLTPGDPSWLQSVSTLRSGLSAYWSLDEYTGTRYDWSKNGNHLTSNNSVGQVTGPSTSTGSGALFVYAQSQYLSRASSASLVMTNTSFTVSAWVYFDAKANSGFNNHLVVKREAQEEWMLQYRNNTTLGTADRLYFSASQASDSTFKGVAAAALGSPALSTWYFVVGWYDLSAQTLNIQVNNGATNSTTSVSSILGSTNRVSLGATYNAGSAIQFFDGRIDEPTIWKRVLSDSERTLLYNSGAGTHFPWAHQSFSNINPKFTQLATLSDKKEQFAFETLNDLIYAVAGVNSSNVETNSVWAYSPVTNTWTKVADYPAKVQSLCVRAVGGKLYGFGGISQVTGIATNTAMYDPSLNTWVAKTAMPMAAEDMASAVIGTKVYLVGGNTNGAPYSPTTYFRVYDTSNDTWTTTNAPIPLARVEGDFGCTDGTNLFCVSATYSTTAYPIVSVTNRVDLYTVATDSWSTLATIPVAVSYRDVEWLNGKIYSFGGCVRDSSNTGTYTTVCQVYDQASNTWSVLTGSTPLTGRGVGMAQYGGKLYICGGYINGWHGELYSFTP